MDASVSRLEGRAERSLELIKEIFEDNYFLKGEIPYYAKVELELEKARILFEREEKEDIGKQLALLQEQLAFRHHQYLYCEVGLLRAEFESNQERSEILDEIENLLDLYQWKLRMRDVDIIRHGGSAILEIGI